MEMRELEMEQDVQDGRIGDEMDMAAKAHSSEGHRVESVIPVRLQQQDLRKSKEKRRQHMICSDTTLGFRKPGYHT